MFIAVLSEMETVLDACALFSSFAVIILFWLQAIEVTSVYLLSVLPVMPILWTGVIGLICHMLSMFSLVHMCQTRMSY